MSEKIALKYRFSDFTLTNYKRLLMLASENYGFALLKDKKHVNKKTVFLRHDIEFSIPIALEMAKIEADLGIEASYFLQIHGDFYNGIERQNLDMVKEIASLGHDIGLHFDSHFWGVSNEQELNRCLGIDKEVLELYIGQELNVFTFHNTTEFILSCKNEMYVDLINPYSEWFKKEVGYCADSTGFWRYEILEERLKENNDNLLQILIHDGMWSDEVLPPRKRIHKVLDAHNEFMKKSYDETLVKFGAKNIDWEGEI